MSQTSNWDATGLQIVGVTDVQAWWTSATGCVIGRHTNSVRTTTSQLANIDALKYALLMDAHFVFWAVGVILTEILTDWLATVSAVRISGETRLALTLSSASDHHAFGILRFASEFQTGKSASLGSERSELAVVFHGWAIVVVLARRVVGDASAAGIVLEWHVVLSAATQGPLVLDKTDGSRSALNVVARIFANGPSSRTRSAHLRVGALVVVGTGDLLNGYASDGQVVRISVRIFGLAHALGSVIATLTVSVWSALSHSTHIGAQAESLWSHYADFVILADRQVVDALVPFTAVH